jgi:long-chain acyl-CoA synthetase
LYFGYTLIHDSTFDVLSTLSTIQKEKSTAYVGTAAMFIMIMDHPEFENYDTSSIKVFGYGGSVMPEETIRRIYKYWPHAGLYNCYGLTEGGTGGVFCPQHAALTKLGAIGIPWGPEQEARIVDENDMDVPVGEIGEIVLRGPNIMKGYYKDEKATEEAMKNGWLHTGDLGRYDSDGYIYFVDRKKDMIVRGGYNVYAVEVENVLYEHPAVSQCAVIGKPHKVLGEDVMAVVVLRPGAKASAEELMAFCKDKLADYKRPRTVDFWETLPLNAMGKVDKKILRASLSV